MTDAQQLVTDAKGLAVAIYRSTHDDTILALNPLTHAAAYQTALKLARALANGSESRDKTYIAIGIQMSRGYLAEIRIVLDIAQEAGGIQYETYVALYERVNRIAEALIARAKAHEKYLSNGSNPTFCG